MARRPRVQFPGAIYHVVTRGDGRRELFHDDSHYQRFTQGLIDEVERSNWQAIAFCWMPNHIHLLLKTPEPNLSSGMQHWLSGYANWYAKRNQRTGHLFQGRYKAFQVEDESYFWTLSRYIHLNPCVGKEPLALSPKFYPHSSYPGYALKRDRLDWVEYDLLYRGWRSEFGGSNPVRSYRRFVDLGFDEGITDPLTDALDDWVIGSKRFLNQIIRRSTGKASKEREKLFKRSQVYSIAELMNHVAVFHDVAPERYIGFRCSAPGRELAALLCRQLTSCTLAELSESFGLKHPDSSANLIKRARRLIKDSKAYQKTAMEIKRTMLKTENQV